MSYEERLPGKEDAENQLKTAFEVGMEEAAVQVLDLIAQVLDTVEWAVRYHLYRDQMNAAADTAMVINHSPLTTALIAARERLWRILMGPAFEIPPLVGAKGVSSTATPAASFWRRDPGETLPGLGG